MALQITQRKLRYLTLIVGFNGTRNNPAPSRRIRTSLFPIIITPRRSDILSRPHQHPQTVPQLRRHGVRKWQDFLLPRFRCLWGCRVPDSVDDRGQAKVNDIRRRLRLEGVILFMWFVTSKDTSGRLGRIRGREGMLVRYCDEDQTEHDDGEVEQ